MTTAVKRRYACGCKPGQCLHAPALLPEKRDVDAAYRLAMAEFRDYKRSKVEYGPTDAVTETARACYESAWTHYQSTKELYGLRLAQEGIAE